MKISLRLLLLLILSVCNGLLLLAERAMEPSFEHIAVEEGLSNYNVGNISQDSLGYLWIGTSRGLNRYDGQEFKTYLFDSESPSAGLPHDMVTQVLCAHNCVFVRTQRGVVVLNQKTDQWVNISSNRMIGEFFEYEGKVYCVFNQDVYCYDFDSSKIVKATGFNNHKVKRLVDSDDGFLWFIGADMKTLFCYDKHSELRRKITVDENILGPDPMVFNHHLVLYKQGGLKFYKIVEHELKQAYTLTQLAGCTVSRLLCLNDHVLAIATMGDGLFLYDSSTDDLVKVHRDDKVSSLNSDFIKNLFIDTDGNFWVSTFDKGLNVDYNEENKFNPHRDLNLKTKDNFINCIMANTYDDDLLFGTRMNGIISQKQGKDHKLNQLLAPYDLESVISIFEDSESKLWIGGIDKLLVYDQKKKRLIKVEEYKGLKHIENITEVDGRVYLVSESSGVKVYSLDGKFISSIASKVYGMNQLIHSSTAKSYLCSIRSGLYVYNRKARRIHHVKLLQNGEAYDWEGAVCLNLENDTTLWVGTLSWGLLKVNTKTHECVNYSKNDGLPGNDVTAIQIDANGQLWLSTSDGLSCMYEEGKFRNFSAHEGVGNFQFHRRSTLQTADNYLYFGGNNGLSYFDPSALILNQSLEGSIVLQGLSSQGVEIKPGDQTGILDASLPYTKSIVLPYDYANFSLSYTMPEVFAHDQLKYAFMLEGWDNEWQESWGVQTVYYTNLPAGEYTFKVKACRGSSLWSTPTTLDIKLKTAPWLSWWAYLIYVVVVLSIVSVIFMLALYRKSARNKLVSEQREHQRENQINEMKHRFFTNISHELRTPLTIIHAISNITAQELNTEESTYHFLRNLRLNTERLKRLVDQLLTFRNLERDTLHVDVSQQHIEGVLKKVVEPFELFTQQKKVTFNAECLLSKNSCAIDRDKFEKILNNLLDNAIKYTPPGGHVDVKVQELTMDEAVAQQWDVTQEGDESTPMFLLCQVIDSGIGIEPEALTHVFDRYYKASSNVDYSGTGIGLNFVKRLVDLQQGQIRAESEVGQGTCISFILPLVEAQESEFADEVLDDETEEETNFTPQEVVKIDIPESFRGKTLLIIEDDVSLNNFLHKTYEDVFKVYSAYNSHEGLILAKNTFPDLIISDVMMGEVDEGLKFCATIKNDPYISHIPVILLTARTEKTQVLEGYSYGADAYVTKPFDIQILSSRILSLIENRQRLQRDMFSNALPKAESKENYNQNDIVFIKKINEIIFEQYKNPEFNIASLSRNLLISRSAFYKKFTQVTKLTPNDYLRKYRIKKAVELMADDQYSITQIVDLVGFNSRSGFYSSFKKEKNMTPSEFIKSKKAEQ